MNAEKSEKNVGYALLVIGLILIILPALLALYIFLSTSQIPQLVPAPTGGDDFTTAFVTFSNVCLIFFVFIVAVWAGSIVSSRGVTMIKDVKLKLVSKSLKEMTEATRKTKEA